MTNTEITSKYPRLSFEGSGLKRLQEILDFLEKRNEPELTEKFLARMKYLNDYAGERSQGCTLRRDYAPFSFAFVMLRQDGESWFNGGMIYHGPGESGAGAPAYSVRIGDRPEDWSIHT